MAARINLDLDNQPKKDVEAGNHLGDLQQVVHPSHNIPWGTVSAVIAIVLFIFWFSDRLEKSVEEEIKPVSESVSLLHTKFDTFKDVYNNDKLDHLKEYHADGASTGDE